MNQNRTIRWGWLKLMYTVTILMPGPWGLATIFCPEIVNGLFQFPSQHPFLYGITGSLWVTFAVLSACGLRDPLRFLPVLMFQLTYKVIWISCVVIPLLIQGRLSVYEILFALSMLAFVAGDLIAIPFWHLFSIESVVYSNCPEPRRVQI